MSCSEFFTGDKSSSRTITVLTDGGESVVVEKKESFGNGGSLSMLGACVGLGLLRSGWRVEK